MTKLIEMKDLIKVEMVEHAKAAKETEPWEAHCEVCDDYMSDVDKEDYDEGCNNICDNC